jgi:methionyl-tRNA formyltransferase
MQRPKSHRLRLSFCGTPQFAVPTLKYLLKEKEFEVAAVFTQPDRPRGRGQEVSFSPVKQAAMEAGVRVEQPEKIRGAESEALLRELMPDFAVIIAYGQIIPARLLTIPKFGWINLHASLLPKYRGAAPINWAIANGETVTGVTTMRIDAGMDTGEMLLRQEMEIGAQETAPELAARMSEAGVPLMVQTLRGVAAGQIVPVAQNEAEASYAPMLKKEDGLIDWKRSAGEIVNRMRGFAPWPGAYTTFRGQNCQVWGEAASKEETTARGDGMAPGSLAAGKTELSVVCGEESLLRVTFVQVEGRKKVSAGEFLSGARLKSEEKFG